MIFFLTFLFSAFCLALFLGLFKKSTYVNVTEDARGRSSEEFNASSVVKVAVALVISLLIAIFSPLSSEMINVGNVGLKVNKMGDDRGLSKTTYVTGFVFYNSWVTDIKEFPITQQHAEYEEGEIITKGGFTAIIKPSFNWSVNSANAADMYQNLRKDVDQIKDEWLKTAVVGAINDVANLYTVDSIFNHRAQFESDIVKEANKRVNKWFTLSQLRTGIVPPKEITEAINAKTKAVQEAQAAVQQKIVAEARAQTQIAQAKGDSAQAVIAASGRAEAVKKEQQFLTPLYIEYLKVQRWKGDVPSTVVGNNGSSVLLNLPK